MKRDDEDQKNALVEPIRCFYRVHSLVKVCQVLGIDFSDDVHLN